MHILPRMPMSYEVDGERSLVRCRTWGRLTNEELREHYRAMGADPSFRPSFRQLGDLRDVDVGLLDAGVVREVAASRVFAPGVRRALVASTDHAYGLSRIFAAYAETGLQEVKVFRDMASAERWLDQEDSHVDGTRGTTDHSGFDAAGMDTSPPR
jgi:hypothetical protein